MNWQLKISWEGDDNYTLESTDYTPKTDQPFLNKPGEQYNKAYLKGESVRLLEKERNLRYKLEFTSDPDIKKKVHSLLNNNMKNQQLIIIKANLIKIPSTITSSEMKEKLYTIKNKAAQVEKKLKSTDNMEEGLKLKMMLMELL